ncbi:hypothetical protein LEMLEM_LOCUS6539 [Lemmus lemmus]
MQLQEWCRRPDKYNCCVWGASAPVSSVTADSSTTRVPDASDQASSHWLGKCKCSELGRR